MKVVIDTSRILYIPENAKIDDIFETAVAAFKAGKAYLIDATEKPTDTIIVLGLESVDIMDIPDGLRVSAIPFPDEFGPSSSPPKPGEPIEYKKVVVTGPYGVNMRSGPNTSFAKIRNIPNGETVVVLEENINGGGVLPWIKIDFEGREGYVYSSLVKKL